MGHTCGSAMDIPFYDSKEKMKTSMLTAFQLCGEIDDDGAPDEYGSEAASSDDDENADENDDDSEGSLRSINLKSRQFPVFIPKGRKRKENEDSEVILEQLNSDDESNQADLDAAGINDFEGVNLRI